jgi:hypothetical protein
MDSNQGTKMNITKLIALLFALVMCGEALGDTNATFVFYQPRSNSWSYTIDDCIMQVARCSYREAQLGTTWDACSNKLQMILDNANMRIALDATIASYQSRDTNRPKYVVQTPDEIRALCAAGEVCRVIGHSWQSCQPPNGYERWLDVTKSPYRKCAICGLVQTKKETWE